jgi:FkbM family methyltransferase
MRAIFKTDFDLKKQIKVKSKHTGIKLFVTPRYIDHYVQHDYEAFSVEVVQRLIKDYDCFADIGAHYGYFALVAQQQQTQIELVAVEPVRENFVLLKKNLELTKGKFAAYNIAASNEKAEVTFNIIEASDSCGFYNHPLAEIKETVTVQSDKVDNVLDSKRKLFIKIDVEGHEIKVLEGMKKILAQKPPLLIEFNPDCQKMAGFTPEAMLQRLAKLGYVIYFLNESSYEYLQYNHRKPKNWQTIIDVHGYCNILCVAPSQKTKVNNVLNSLQIKKFIGSDVPINENPTKTLAKTKASFEMKIAKLESQKRSGSQHLSRIVKSDYFKAWQWLVRLFKKARHEPS